MVAELVRVWKQEPVVVAEMLQWLLRAVALVAWVLGGGRVSIEVLVGALVAFEALSSAVKARAVRSTVWAPSTVKHDWIDQQADHGQEYID